MSEANKSLMLSEAEIIEAINSDSLISVSLGAGQPQKNVKMSTLATVAAGMIGIAGLDNNGLMPEGLYARKGNAVNYIDAGGSYNLGGLEDINGFVIIRDGYSWGGLNLYWCSYTKVYALAKNAQSHTLEYVDGNYILTNNGSQRRGYQIFIQKIRY